MELDADAALNCAQIRALLDNLVVMPADDSSLASLLAPVYLCQELEAANGTIAPDQLKALHLSAAAAHEFCHYYNATKSYLTHHPELTAGIEQLRSLMEPLNARAPTRDPRLIVWEEGQVIGLSLLGVMCGQDNIEQWSLRLNCAMALRAVICALVPSLPAPPFLFDASWSHSFFQLFCQQYYQSASYLKDGNDACSQYFDNWQHLYEQTHAPLTSYCPHHGLVSGFECSVSKPRFITLLPIGGIYSNRINLLYLYNCSFQQVNELRLQAFELDQVTAKPSECSASGQELNDQWVDEISPVLKASLPARSSCIFIGLTPEQLHPDWISGILHTGNSFLLDATAYLRGREVATILKRPFRGGRTQDHRLSFTSKPYYYHRCPCQTTVQAIKLDHIGKTLRERILKQYPRVRSLIQYERKDYISQANPQVITSQARTRYFFTDVDVSSGDNFERLLCVLTELELWGEFKEFQQYWQDRPLDDETMRHYSMPLITSRLDFNQIGDVLDQYNSHPEAKPGSQLGLPAAAPEFVAAAANTAENAAADADADAADTDNLGAQLTLALYIWEGIFHYLAARQGAPSAKPPKRGTSAKSVKSAKSALS